jgi:hypothetical protein
MIFFLRSSLVVVLLFLVQNTYGQFEKISVRNTSIEYEKDLIADTSAHYLKIMLCGDLIHKSQLLKKYAQPKPGQYNYRSWFRQVKPLFFYPDYVVGSLRSFFPNRANISTFPNSAPDEFLAELEYTGFNVLMMSNADALTDREHLNQMTLKKLNYTDIFRVGSYSDTLDKKSNFPLVLEKKDMRIAFLNYSCDSVLLDLPSHQVSFFQLDSIRRDVKKAKDTMLAEYVIAYIDWAKQDSLKLGKVAELLNMGIDVIIGTGNGQAFTSADLLSFSDGSLKLHVDNIGYFNAESNERERDKSAVVEIVLKKDKASKRVTTHDMGFIPLWTLIDHDRYAVLPISNIEEKHIEDINLNIVQYSTMKVALTDLRYAFFDKIPELHYDFNDRVVENVEQTAFIRKTLMREQDKINEVVKNNAITEYINLFGSKPPSHGSLDIPYEDIWDMYPKKPRKKNNESIRDTIEIYGEKDELSPRGVVSIKANHKHYQRERVKVLSAREKFIIDSTRQYNERFIIVDSIAELKKLLKRRKQDSARRRDSMFQASLNPNYKSTYNPSAEIVKAPEYKPIPVSGVYTQPEATREGNLPVRNIEEYFMVQIYTLSSKKPIDLDKSPYLSGYEIRYEDSYYRYYIGRTNSKALAIELLRSIRGKGHPDAILVKYTDGVRTTVKTNF